MTVKAPNSHSHLQSPTLTRCPVDCYNPVKRIPCFGLDSNLSFGDGCYFLGLLKINKLSSMASVICLCVLEALSVRVFVYITPRCNF